MKVRCEKDECANNNDGWCTLAVLCLRPTNMYNRLVCLYFKDKADISIKAGE